MKLMHFIKKNKTLSYAVGLFLFALIIRVLFVNDGLFHADSVNLAIPVEKTAETLILHPTVVLRYGLVLVNAAFFTPLYYLGLKHADRLITYTEIVFASLAVSYLYLFVRRWLKNNYIALSSALLYSVAPIYLSMTTHAKGHGLALFFAFAALYYLVLGIEKSSIRYIAVSSLILGSSLFIRETNIVMFLPFGLIFLTHRKDMDLLKTVWSRLSPRQLAAACIPALLMIILVMIFQNQAIFGQVGYASWLGLFSEKGGLATGWLLKSLAFGLGAPFILIGLFYYIAKKEFNSWVLLAWFIIPFAYFANVANVEPRYLLIPMVPLFVLIGISMNMIYERKKVAGIVLTAILCIALFATIFPVINYRHNYSGQKEFALFVKENTPENAVVYGVDETIFIKYYADREIKVPGLKGFRFADKDKIKAEIIDYLEKGRPVYIIGSGLIYDPEGKVFNMKDDPELRYKLIGVKENDDFHSNAGVSLRVFNESLYRIKLKI